MQHKIKKDFANTPPALAKVFEEQKEALLAEASTHDFKGYRVVKDLLLDLAKHKCLYCDTRVYLSSDEDDNNKTKIKATATIEHYRPKSCGYWWLGYEWTNLYILCKGCNGRKLGRFPIAGTKVKAPVINKKGLPKCFDLSHRFRVDCPELLAEKPLYLNPELVDDADYYFCVQENGKLTVRDGLQGYEKECAETTLTILHASNDTIDRKTIIKDWKLSFIEELEKIAKGANTNDLDDKILKLYSEAQDMDLEFNLTRRQLWQEMERLLLKGVSPDYADFLRLSVLKFIDRLT